MEEKIVFRAVIEVLGKPQEYIEEALKEYITRLKTDKGYKILCEERAEARKLEKQELWAIFTEVEVETLQLTHLLRFCFDYMPSVIEVIRPKELPFTEGELSIFLSDLQGKLHHVDMVAKQMKFEHDHIKLNMHKLLRNYVTIILGNKQLTSQQLSQLTGVDQDKLEDYLDKLIDEGHIDLKEGKYFLISKVMLHGQ